MTSNGIPINGSARQIASNSANPTDIEWPEQLFAAHPAL